MNDKLKTDLEAVLQVHRNIGELSQKLSASLDEVELEDDIAFPSVYLKEMRRKLEELQESAKNKTSELSMGLKTWFCEIPTSKQSIINKVIVLGEKPSEIELSVLDISDKEMNNLLELKNSISWLFMSPYQRFLKRWSIIGLANKFRGEGNNEVKLRYYYEYIRLLDKLEVLAKNEKNVRPIFEYLNSKEFNMNIPSSYLSELRQYPNLAKDVDSITSLSSKLSS